MVRIIIVLIVLAILIGLFLYSIIYKNQQDSYQRSAYNTELYFNVQSASPYQIEVSDGRTGKIITSLASSLITPRTYKIDMSPWGGISSIIVRLIQGSEVLVNISNPQMNGQFTSEFSLDHENNERVVQRFL